jgi:hypothetical protein
VTKPVIKAIADRCTLIADKVVPKYRAAGGNYGCTGIMAKRWQAAWDAACIALGHDPDIIATMDSPATRETDAESDLADLAAEGKAAILAKKRGILEPLGLFTKEQIEQILKADP